MTRPAIINIPVNTGPSREEDFAPEFAAEFGLGAPTF